LPKKYLKSDILRTFYGTSPPVAGKVDECWCSI